MDDMSLVHETEIEVSGDRYEVRVYCRQDGRHFARTSFAADDIIIHDGASLEEVLVKHEQLLPLAVSSRRMLQEYRGTALAHEDSGHS
jgi:hypothetical protein